MSDVWFFVVVSDVTGLILVNPLPEDLFSYDNHVWSDYWCVNYFVSDCSMLLSLVSYFTSLYLLIRHCNSIV